MLRMLAKEELELNASVLGGKEKGVNPPKG